VACRQPEQRRGQERLTGVAALLLLLAVAVGLLGQGGYYGPVQRLVGLLVAAATLLAMVARPPDRDDARLLPVVPALALVAWALADAVLLGVPPAGGLGLAATLSRAGGGRVRGRAGRAGLPPRRRGDRPDPGRSRPRPRWSPGAPRSTSRWR
jgi:hypothetical protein